MASYLGFGTSQFSGSLRVNDPFLGALYPPKSELINKHIVKHIGVSWIDFVFIVSAVGPVVGLAEPMFHFWVPCSRPSLTLVNEDKVSKSDTLSSCRVPVAGGHLDRPRVYCQCRDSVEPNCRIVCSKHIVKHSIKQSVQRK